MRGRKSQKARERGWAPTGLSLLAVIAAVGFSAFVRAEPGSAETPAWYQKKKASAAAEAKPPQPSPQGSPQASPQPSPQPSPVASPAPTPLPASPPSASPQPAAAVPAASPPPEPGFLFKREGLTASLDLGLSKLSQPEISGMPLSGSYSMGWWWKRNLVLSVGAGIDALFGDGFTFLLYSVGPTARYFTQERDWAFRAGAAFAFSQGLSRADAARIPPPPADTALMARRGFLFGLHATHFTWKKRDLAVGPSLGVRFGWQGERSVMEITAAFTFQDGRPVFAGEPQPEP